jgi:vacuolar-type H+-ATPase subunit H
MKPKNQVFLTLVLKSALVFSPLLLAGIATGSTPVNRPEVISAQKVQAQQLTPERVSPRVEPGFNNTNVLWNVWLVILSLFPVSVIALFWLLRRVAIREIVHRAMAQLDGLENLQNQLIIVKQDAENLIRESKQRNRELETEILTLQHNIQAQQDNLANLASEMVQSKDAILGELKTTIKEIEENLESDFTVKVSQLHLAAEQTRDRIIEGLENLESGLIHKLENLQLEAEQQKNLTRRFKRI